MRTKSIRVSARRLTETQYIIKYTRRFAERKSARSPRKRSLFIIIIIIIIRNASSAGSIMAACSIEIRENAIYLSYLSVVCRPEYGTVS